MSKQRFWKYTSPPQGICPIQAEGTILKTGEKFYFNARLELIRFSVSGPNCRHGLENPIWQTSKELEDAASLTREEIDELIEGWLMDFILLAEGLKTKEATNLICLDKWRRRKQVRKALEEDL